MKSPRQATSLITSYALANVVDHFVGHIKIGLPELKDGFLEVN